MSSPSIDPGDPLGIATVGNIVRAGNIYVGWWALKGARKETDATKTADDAAAADPELVLNLSAGSYALSAYLIWDSAVAAGIRYGWDLPAGSSIAWAPSTASTAAAVTGAPQTAPGAGVRVLQSTVAQGVLVSTGGPVTLLWAQATADPTVTTLRTGSAILAARFA